jgi:hypothetical protein
MGQGPGYRVSGFGLRVKHVGSMGLGLGFRGSGQGSGFRVSSFGFHIYGFESRGLGFRGVELLASRHSQVLSHIMYQSNGFGK